jgi:hypothetical protein
MGRYEAQGTDLVSKGKAIAASISPKVKAGFVWGISALLAMAVLEGITPEMFASLGVWENMARNVVTVALTLLGAYLKSDPLRDLGAAVVAEEVAKAPSE